MKQVELTWDEQKEMDDFIEKSEEKMSFGQ